MLVHFKLIGQVGPLDRLDIAVAGEMSGRHTTESRSTCQDQKMYTVNAGRESLRDEKNCLYQ